MYYPTHRPQLTGISTQSVDCGVRSTQMGLDWLSKGEVIRSVKVIRDLGGMGDGATNYYEWDKVIDILGGSTLGFSGEKTNDWQRTVDHLKAGGAVIYAVDYGQYRKSMQSKSGSLTFDGAHAILMIGQRVKNGVKQTRSFDSLLDGRYAGCPNGPVWVPQWKVKQSVQALGAVYALLLHRDPNVDNNDPGDLLPNPGVSLSDILSELSDIQDSNPMPELEEVITDLETILGITRNPEADVSSSVEPGIGL